MSEKQLREYTEAVAIIQTLSDRMSKNDGYGASWGIRADDILDDMRDYLDEEETH